VTPRYVVEALPGLPGFAVVDRAPDGPSRKSLVECHTGRAYCDTVARYLNAEPGTAEAADAHAVLARYWRMR